MKLPSLPTGAALKLSQKENVLGGSIWPAASAMCHFLLDHHRHSLPMASTGTSKVIELGSGTGAVGIFAAGLGFRVHLTEYKPPSAAVMPFVPYQSDGSLDLDFMGHEDFSSDSDCLLQLLAKNVESNRHIFPSSLSQAPLIHELNWTKVEHIERVLGNVCPNLEGFDYVLASDVTYFTNLHGDLANTISKLLKNSPMGANTNMIQWPTCFVAHQRRVLGRDYQLESFEKAIAKVGMTISSISLDRSLEEQSDNVTILEIRHKQQQSHATLSG